MVYGVLICICIVLHFLCVYLSVSFISFIVVIHAECGKYFKLLYRHVEFDFVGLALITF